MVVAIESGMIWRGHQSSFEGAGNAGGYGGGSIGAQVVVDFGLKVGAIFKMLSQPKRSLGIARKRLVFVSHEVGISHLCDIKEHCQAQAERGDRSLYG